MQQQQADDWWKETAKKEAAVAKKEAHVQDKLQAPQEVSAAECNTETKAKERAEVYQKLGTQPAPMLVPKAAPLPKSTPAKAALPEGMLKHFVSENPSTLAHAVSLTDCCKL